MSRGRSDKSRPVAVAFRERREHKEMEGLRSDGTSLTLYGNRIAWWEGSALHVQVNGFGGGTADPRGWRMSADYLAGNFGASPVTRYRLSMIPGVSLWQWKRQLYLNGCKWDGLDRIVKQEPRLTSVHADFWRTRQVKPAWLRQMETTLPYTKGPSIHECVNAHTAQVARTHVLASYNVMGKLVAYRRTPFMLLHKLTEIAFTSDTMTPEGKKRAAYAIKWARRIRQEVASRPRQGQESTP